MIRFLILFAITVLMVLLNSSLLNLVLKLLAVLPEDEAVDGDLPQFKHSALLRATVLDDANFFYVFTYNVLVDITNPNDDRVRVCAHVVELQDKAEINLRIVDENWHVVKTSHLFPCSANSLLALSNVVNFNVDDESRIDEVTTETGANTMTTLIRFTPGFATNARPRMLLVYLENRNVLEDARGLYVRVSTQVTATAASARRIGTELRSALSDVRRSIDVPVSAIAHTIAERAQPPGCSTGLHLRLASAEFGAESLTSALSALIDYEKYAIPLLLASLFVCYPILTARMSGDGMEQVALRRGNLTPMRLFTSTWAHADVFHLISNAVMLASTAPSLLLALQCSEMWFLAVYIGSALTAALASVATTRHYTVGASGAIYGVQAAWMLLDSHARAASMILSFVIANAVRDLVSGRNINVAAHVGGALGGFLVAKMYSLMQ